MYSTCLYCSHNLERNEVIEMFPVGRRLAFDQAKGRLWVVCRKCEKWNLTPFEERWEAIEDCERRFQDARKRVSSDNVGLARLDEGLELVRIGSPLRPEFAAWPYGDQFGRRRRTAILIGTGAAVAIGGAVVAGAAAGVFSGGGWGMWQLFSGVYRGIKRRRVVARVRAPSGQRLTVRGMHAERARLLSPVSHAEGWGLYLPHAEGTASLYGDEARRATAIIMPRINSGGASRDRVQDAVRRIEMAGDPAAYLEYVAGRPMPIGRWSSWNRSDTTGLPKLPLETRLAIEMAVNEENERIALEGELTLLELEWREADELAAIADTLGMPEEIDAQLADLHRRADLP